MGHKLPTEFEQAIPVMNKIREAGFEAYFVGGCVRDLLLGTPIHDIDIATNAFPQEIKGIFPRTIDVGIEHGTVLVLYHQNKYEITTFRTESGYQDFRRPDEVVFVRKLADDLKRRDFTINALAMTTEGQMIDLFGGQADLQRKIIRAVGEPQERFHEDALRMMRAVRFASQLGFSIEEQTLAAIKDHHALLHHISVERIQIEFIKLMSESKRSIGLTPFLECGLYESCPGFSNHLTGLTKLMTLPETEIKKEAVIWTIIAYFLNLKENEVNRFLRAWKLSNQLIKTVGTILPAYHYRLHDFWTPLTVYPLSREEVIMVEEMLALTNQTGRLSEALACYDGLTIHSLKDLSISGADILASTKKKPGPWVGELLEEVEEKVILKDLPNDSQRLMQYVSERGDSK
ncbi:CCA tRNA nucleotidyltransferase [Vagococcus elongatus]|uniref:CCA-adding enzyme n=1 Tax=Vagococcus elongatus TaxID=180344 RepID=A0A430B5E0_9ENTE|nr:CCA tRNA nucleotidyltransferase [Vagococcus elongatus]RSU15586.1 CCA tRNA nucleotidyltransferase [Vagococcus elongatus]